MMSSSVARLTRQLTQLSVAAHSAPPCFSSLTKFLKQASTQMLCTGNPYPTLVSVRGFATSKKKSKKKGSPSKASSSTDEGSSPKDPQPFLQNQEWAKFQQSIQVEGFQTGQATTATVLKKSKGGKQARNRKARELQRMQQMDPTLQAPGNSSSKFPAIRYSPEETEELLKLAFETLPERAGKRGTRNLKRQGRRWKLVREIRSKYKRQIQDAHERRMEHRQWKREQTKAVKEAAPELCQEDAQYQATILRRWAATMFPTESADLVVEQNDNNIAEKVSAND